jgi:putrescine transport system substrate-binding protein
MNGRGTHPSVAISRAIIHPPQPRFPQVQRAVLMAIGSRGRHDPAGGMLRGAACRVIACVLLSGFFAVAQGEEKRLHIYNWADFIGSRTLQRFERQTGIKVVYDTYDAEETMEAKLLTGGSGYDVVSASTNFFSREIKAGVYRPLDKRKLPNWKNLDPKVLALQSSADPGNAHAVPYLHAINGFTYNVDMIKARMPNAPLDSLDMLFNPDVVRRFADCGVSLLDSPDDTMQLALVYLGLDPNSRKREDFEAVQRMLARVRPYVRKFDSVEYMNSLADRDLCIAMSWSSDYANIMARAREAGTDLNLAFTIPREGANLNFSSLLVPVDAPHPEAAHKFLNFILQPDVIAEITNEIYYGNSNRAANAQVRPEILNDPAIYPNDRVKARLYTTKEMDMATQRVRTRIWTRITTGT